MISRLDSVLRMFTLEDVYKLQVEVKFGQNNFQFWWICVYLS